MNDDRESGLNDCHQQEVQASATEHADKPLDVPQPDPSLVHVPMTGVAAVCGVALRIGLETGAPSEFYAYLFANFLGTAVLAAWAGFKDFVHIELFVSVGTGFCGTLTTFSSWAQAGGVLFGPTTLLSKTEKAYLWFQLQLVGFAVYLLGYDFGRHTFDAYASIHPPPRTSGAPEVSDCAEALYLLCSLAIFGLVAALVAIDSTGVRLALAFAAPGAWLRFVLAKKLNPLNSRFPVGTFTANMLGSALLATFYVLGIAVVDRNDAISCEVLKGLISGFCGGLSTVSTFILELKKLKRIDAYIYGFTSVVVSQLLFLIILGPFQWSTRVSLEDFTSGNSCTTLFA